MHCLIVINNETENIVLEFLTFPLNTMETKNNTYKFYLASKNIVPRCMFNEDAAELIHGK